MSLAPKLVLPLSEIFFEDGTMRDYAAAKILLKVNSISSRPTILSQKTSTKIELLKSLDFLLLRTMLLLSQAKD